MIFTTYEEDPMDWNQWFGAHYTRPKKTEELRKLAIHLRGAQFFVSSDVSPECAVRELDYKSYANFRAAAWLYAKRGDGGFILHEEPAGVESTYTWASGFLEWLFPDGFPWEEASGDPRRISVRSGNSGGLAQGALEDDGSPALALVKELQQQMGELAQQCEELHEECDALSSSVSDTTRAYDASRDELKVLLTRVRELQETVVCVGRDMVTLRDAQSVLESERRRVSEQQTELDGRLEQAIERAGLYQEVRQRFLALPPEDREQIQALYGSSVDSSQPA